MQSLGLLEGRACFLNSGEGLLKVLVEGFHFACLFSPWPSIYPAGCLCMSEEGRITLLCRNTGFISDKEVSQMKLIGK
jgi:hypothetical protein